MAYRMVKWTMAVLAAACPLLTLLVPALEKLRGDVFAWILYGAYVLVTVMVWGIGGKATRNVGQGIDKDRVNKEAKLTRELQRKWFWMPRV